MGGFQLDEIDHEILELLHEDGRTPYNDIGAALDISGNTVKRRIEEMKQHGVIKGFTVLTNPAEMGYIPVAFGLSAEPGKTDAIAEELSRYDNVYKVWILSGRHNIIFHACFEDVTDFQNFNHNVLHNIEGIANFESSLATRSVVDDGSVVLPRDS